MKTIEAIILIFAGIGMLVVTGALGFWMFKKAKSYLLKFASIGLDVFLVGASICLIVLGAHVGRGPLTVRRLDADVSDARCNIDYAIRYYGVDNYANPDASEAQHFLSEAEGELTQAQNAAASGKTVRQLQRILRAGEFYVGQADGTQTYADGNCD